MRSLVCALFLTLATPAAGDVAAALDGVILPGVAGFARAAGDLADAAAADCRRPALLPAYGAAREAWGRIGDFRLGPTEAAALTIAFWPDDRGSGQRALAGARAAEAPPVPARLPASARGFAGLDLLLGDPGLDYGPGDPGCALAAALAADLAAQAQALARGWQDHAALLRDPGGPGNLIYLDPADALRALQTQALSAVQLTRDSRIARPLGTAARPRPTRAEAWRTGRALPNALASARAAAALAGALSGGPLPETETALAGVERAGAAITDPALQDPAGRGALEALHRALDDLHAAMHRELTAATGLAPGFNAHDGD